MARGRTYNYTKQKSYQKEGIRSTLMRDNPIVTSPGYLISKNLVDIGEKLVDFLPKLSAHFSVKGSKPLEDPSSRLVHYGITEDNKIFSIGLLVHDMKDKEIFKYRDFIKTELNPSKIEISNNLMYFYWENGTTNLMGIGETIFYLGAAKLCDKE